MPSLNWIGKDKIENHDRGVGLRYGTIGVNKNPTIDTLTKIAKALEVGVDNLIK